MSSRELRRVEVLSRVKSKELKLVDAAALLEVSYRQAKRLWRRYRCAGAAGLKHRNVGRASARAKPGAFRQQVLRRVREKYSGEVGQRFGPTLAAEHLASEDGLHIAAETLRRWMLAEGLWSGERKRKPHRQRRERKRHFGELVQMDGSFHPWLEERGPEGCLMDMVDDATGTTLGRLGEQETIWAAAHTLRGWIERYGVPQALYVDWKNLYQRPPSQCERLRGEAPITQFGRMCAKLGIGLMAAGSPQAKGRVERNHGTHQDRLVKKLRRQNIRTHEQANAYLHREYLPEHNRRFARPAAAPENYHRAAPSADQLRKIFRLESERTISNDWVVRYQGRFFQLQRASRHYAPAQARVMVCEWPDGTLEIEYRGQTLPWREIATAPAQEAQRWTEKSVRGRKYVPPPDHPWRQGYEQRQRAALSEPTPTVVRVAASASP